MGGPRYNRDGTPLTAKQIALQKMQEEERRREQEKRPEVTAVLSRAKFLKPYIGEIVEVYTKGGVRGFKFTPTNYGALKGAIDQHLNGFVVDGVGKGGHPDVLGAFMGSDAKKHGFSLSIRSKSSTSSVHIELKKTLCDAHIDSVSTTAAVPGRPYWGSYGQYNPTAFADHFIKDLLPFYLEDPPPIPVFGTLLKNPTVYKAFTKGLSRTSVDLKLNERYDPDNPMGNLPGSPRKDTRLTFTFSVLEWK